MDKPKSRLEFKDPKTPFSSVFDDVYFAKDMGIEESICVYLEGSGMLNALREGHPELRVGEVGFGVGLNFLLTLRAFLENGNPNQKLHYASAEKFPVEAEDLRILYSAYPEILPYAELLIEAYPVLTPGPHRLFFADGRVILDLWIGDAAEQFSKADFVADFWYWDGFAPSKNPEAFSEALFAAVLARSSPLAQGASFTVAGWVRRNLEKSGFQIEKRPGFGKKRERLYARRIQNDLQSDLPKAPCTLAPWFSRKKIRHLSKAKPDASLRTKQIAVLGAGLAGSAIARTLADRGYSVEVWDGNGIAGCASSNSAGLFNVQLSRKPNPISRMAQASLIHFLGELQRLQIPHHLGIVRNDPETEICLRSEGFPESFFEVRGKSVMLPFCGFLNPKTLCETRLKHPGIRFHPKAIARVVRMGEYFELLDEEGSVLGESEHVVYALGAEMARETSALRHPFFKSFDSILLRAIRGQILRIRPTKISKTLHSTLAEEGYVTPIDSQVTGHEFHVLGATYQSKEIAPDQSERDTEKLLNDARKKWSEFSEIDSSSVVDHRIGFRASTADKLPLIGPLFDPKFLECNYLASLRGGPSHGLPPLEVSPGEWLLMGLGSRGITFSSLGAEILASLMTGEALPVETDLFEHLHPARFEVRRLRRASRTKNDTVLKEDI